LPVEQANALINSLLRGINRLALSCRGIHPPDKKEND
jgi:hypothetical protein